MPLVPEEVPANKVKEVIRIRSRFIMSGQKPTAWPRSSTTEEPILLESAIVGRRSVYEFSQRSLMLKDLISVLELAEISQRRQWAASADQDEFDLTVLVAPYQVEGLNPSRLQRWCSTQQRMHALEELPWISELPRRYTAAPCLLLIGNAINRAGAAGYGELLVRVGALAYAIWLSARTHGLDSSVFAAASPEVSRGLAALEPGSRHLFTIALGYAPPGTAP